MHRQVVENEFCFGGGKKKLQRAVNFNWKQGGKRGDRNADIVVSLFNLCHSTVYGGMGSVSINLEHLPCPGLVTEQPAKLIEMFEIIKAQSYECHTEANKRAAK